MSHFHHYLDTTLRLTRPDSWLSCLTTTAPTLSADKTISIPIWAEDHGEATDSKIQNTEQGSCKKHCIDYLFQKYFTLSFANKPFAFVILTTVLV